MNFITPELIIALTGLVSVIGALFQRRRVRRERRDRLRRASGEIEISEDADAYYEYLENPSVPPSGRPPRRRRKDHG